MKSYAWSCYACAATNPPENTRCARCGCAAQATGAQIEDARQTWRHRSGIAPPAPFDLAAELKALPLLLIAAGACAALGVAALVVGAGASFPTVSVFGALLLALAALCLSSYRAPPQAP